MANTRAVYDYMVSAREQVPEYSTFAEKMKSPEYVEAVRSYMQSAGEQVPDSSTFFSKYANNADQIREQVKSQYTQDVAAQKQQAIDEYNRANPITSALFPRSSIDAATGDRGVIGSLYDAFADVSSMPGRAVARVVSGDNEIDAQEHPFLAKVHEIGKNVATDPLLIPSFAIGGPVASGLAKSGLTGAKLLGASVASGAGLNTALGAIGRGGSQDQTVKAFDPKAMAYDAAFGAGGEVLGTTAMGIGRWLKSKGTGKLGSEVIDALTAEERLRLARALRSTGDIPTPRGARAYTRTSDVTEAERKAIAEYAGKVLAQDPYKPSFADPNKLGREGGLFGSGRKALASNLETKATSAKRDVSDMFTDLDQEFQSTQMKNDTYARSYEPIGMDESDKMIYQNPNNPIEFAVEQDLSARGINPANSVDIAFDDFRNKSGVKNVSDVTERAARLKSDLEVLGGEGYISPSQANAWARDLLEEASALRASKSGKTQVAEFLENTANQVNRRLEDMGRNAGKAGEKMVPIYEDAEGNFLRGAEYIPELHGKTYQKIGEEPEVQFPYKETVARKEALGQISQGAKRIGSSAEGIDPWKFIAAPKLALAQTLARKLQPPSKALALGSEIEASGTQTIGDLFNDIPYANRIKSALREKPKMYEEDGEIWMEGNVDAGSSPKTRPALPSKARVAVAQVGKMIADTPLASGIARTAYQHLQNRRDLTEMEYKNIRSILGVPEKSRTPDQIAYLKKYGY